MSVGPQAEQPLGRAGVSAALDGTGDARWGDHSRPHAESLPETGMNLMTAARLCTGAALSCSAVPPSDFFSARDFYSGSPLQSAGRSAGLDLGCLQHLHSGKALGTSFNLAAFVWSSPESGPCFCRAAVGIIQQCSEAP